MPTNLTQAFTQWHEQPAGNRFETLQGGYEKAVEEKNNSAEVNRRVQRFEAIADDNTGGLALNTEKGNPFALTHYAFSQLAQRMGAPAGYLQGLPPSLAAMNLNHGLRSDSASVQVYARLPDRDAGTPGEIKAVTSDRYKRIYNSEVLSRLGNALPPGWRTPPARPVPGMPGQKVRLATEADVLKGPQNSLSIKVGDPIAPAGVYVSDRDMFVLQINEDLRVYDGTDEGLCRGFMLWNSEVGDRSIGGLSFLYKTVCGNHIIWGAENIQEFKFRHTGAVRSRAWRGLAETIVDIDRSSVKQTEESIRQAKTLQLGKGREETVAETLKLAGKVKAPITKKAAEAAYDAAERHQDWYKAPPTSLWGMVQGFTEASDRKHAGARADRDRAASKLLDAVL